jgi:hypothetical protein
MITMQALGLVPGATSFEAEQLTTIVDGADTERAALAQPAEPSTTPDDSNVPVKQLLRWQDDGGALPPAR